MSGAEGVGDLVRDGGKEVVHELIDFAAEEAKRLVERAAPDELRALIENPTVGQPQLTALQREALRQRLMRYAWYTADARDEQERRERFERAGRVAMTVLKIAVGAALAAV